MDLSKIIAERRKYLGLNQADLADLSQVGIATVKDIERGKGNPSVKTLEKICTVLGLEISLNIKRLDL